MHSPEHLSHVISDDMMTSSDHTLLLKKYFTHFLNLLTVINHKNSYELKHNIVKKFCNLFKILSVQMSVPALLPLLLVDKLESLVCVDMSSTHEDMICDLVSTNQIVPVT